MNLKLFALMFLCLGGLLDVTAQSVDNGLDDGQQLERRYAEAALSSDISKMLDSVDQKNFVNFLLRQREKKNVHYMMPERPELNFCKDLLLKKLDMWLHSKGDRLKGSVLQKAALFSDSE